MNSICVCVGVCTWITTSVVIKESDTRLAKKSVTKETSYYLVIVVSVAKKKKKNVTKVFAVLMKYEWR